MFHRLSAICLAFSFFIAFSASAAEVASKSKILSVDSATSSPKVFKEFYFDPKGNTSLVKVEEGVTAGRYATVKCKFDSTGATISTLVYISTTNGGGCSDLVAGAGQNICNNTTSISVGSTSINNSTFQSCTNLP